MKKIFLIFFFTFIIIYCFSFPIFSLNTDHSSPSTMTVVGIESISKSVDNLSEIVFGINQKDFWYWLGSIVVNASLVIITLLSVKSSIKNSEKQAKINQIQLENYQKELMMTNRQLKLTEKSYISSQIPVIDLHTNYFAFEFMKVDSSSWKMDLNSENRRFNFIAENHVSSIALNTKLRIILPYSKTFENCFNLKSDFSYFFDCGTLDKSQDLSLPNGFTQRLAGVFLDALNSVNPDDVFYKHFKEDKLSSALVNVRISFMFTYKNPQDDLIEINGEVITKQQELGFYDTKVLKEGEKIAFSFYMISEIESIRMNHEVLFNKKRDLENLQ